MKIRNTILLMAFATVFSACEGMFEPAVENYRDKEEMYRLSLLLVFFWMAIHEYLQTVGLLMM